MWIILSSHYDEGSGAHRKVILAYILVTKPMSGRSRLNSWKIKESNSFYMEIDRENVCDEIK